MQHLLNFINEIQHLPITKEKYYQIGKGKNIKTIHSSELKPNQKYKNEIELKSIDEYYTSNEYALKLYNLLNSALTEVVLMPKEQQLTVLARLRNIKGDLLPIQKFLYGYNTAPQKDNWEEHDLLRLLKRLFPLVSIPAIKPDKNFKWIFSSFIDTKINAVTFLKNAIGDNTETFNSFSKYAIDNLQVIQDPYIVIECGISGLKRIRELYQNQIREIKRFPKDKEPPFTEEQKESWRVLNTFYINQELPFIDLLQFRMAIRKVLLNSTNPEQLKTVLKDALDIAKSNIDMYIQQIQHLVYINRTGKYDKVPDELTGVKVETQDKHLIYETNFMVLSGVKEQIDADKHIHIDFFRNIDFALHSQRVYHLIKSEVFKEELSVIEQSKGTELNNAEIEQKTINISSDIIEPLFEIIRGYFDDDELLLKALMGQPITRKIVYRKTAKELVSIFRYFMVNHKIYNNKDKTGMWLIDTFCYTSKNQPTDLNPSTVFTHLNKNDQSPPIPDLIALLHKIS